MQDQDVIYLSEDEIARLQGEGGSVLSSNNFGSSSQSVFSQKDSVLGVFELDFKPFLVQLQLDLLGLQFDEKKKVFKKVNDPLMPLVCVRKLVNFLRSILFLNTPMTNLDEDRIKMSISSLQKALDRMLFDFGYYDGVDVSVLWYLSRSCGQQIENALYRAKDGLERQLRASNINVQAQQKFPEVEDRKKKSLFPNFFRRRKE